MWEKPPTTQGSNTVVLRTPYAKRKFPHFVWKFPLQAVFTHVGGFSLERLKENFNNNGEDEAGDDPFGVPSRFCVAKPSEAIISVEIFSNKKLKMHQAYTVKKIIRETPNAVSLILNGNINYKTGQFIMLWLPGIDEKPFAISHLEKNEFGITIEEKGIFTKKISKIKPGTKIGIRGPYGNGFKIKNNSIIVAGGLGMAPALPLIKKIKNSIIIQGAKSKKYLLYLKNKDILKIIEKNNNKIIYCTDDGSFGIHSSTTNILKEMINKNIKIVYTCGPEIMIKKVFDICEKNKIECQASLERYMKCGLGLCGSCCINDQLVCKDGPVFNSEQLRKLTELGKFARLKSGRKVLIKEYYDYRY